ncbi:MAG TPA: beta-ribofuranosylaminobenzene 5'-phosphate synthase family protein [Burkholderiaceae bacterium]|nr:beta-ribofuranosylaminobenzene 5'-phosphate synthase family protein [Burkholderiaceae bacterium]
MLDTAVASAPSGWRVHAPGRLHLGFLDPAGSLGRRFGSLGLTVEAFETVVELSLARRDEASVAEPDSHAQLYAALRHLAALRQASGRHAPLRLHLTRLLPPHAGLGSGTQLALAVGHAFCRLHALPYGSAELAKITGRGLRSGIGIAGFDRGGLLLDGGPGANGKLAPLLSRLTLPPYWRVLLVLDPRLQGLNGDEEKRALRELAPLPRAAAAEICHQVLMRVLSGAACGDFESFAAGVTRMQAILGAHFAPAQGGRAFASVAVERLIGALGNDAAIGQSSWGPTGFAVFSSSGAAEAALATLRRNQAVDPALRVCIVRARDEGARFVALSRQAQDPVATI